MKRLLLLLALLAVAIPAAANAGGWATVGLSSLPAGLSADENWPVDITVLQHGRTPLDGVQPVVRIRGADGAVKAFPAKATGKPGVYHADVRFPESGTWSYEVYDGFTQYGGAKTHTFKPVVIGGGSRSSFAVLPVTGIAFALLLAAALAFVLRRGRPGPEPPAAGR
jgi:hypothetical protein